MFAGRRDNDGVIAMAVHPFDQIKAAQSVDGAVPVAMKPTPPPSGSRHPFDLLKELHGVNKAPAAPLSSLKPAGAETGRLASYQAVLQAALSAMAPMDDLKLRAKYKRETALPQVRPFVEAYMADGANYPNDVAVFAMIWAFDVGDIEFGLKLGLHLVKQGCHPMPARFDRDMPTFIGDAVAEWALEQLEAEQSAAPYLDDLLRVIERDQWPLFCAVHSKLLVLAAKHAKLTGDWPVVLERCEAAQRVNPEKHGTKTLQNEARAKLAPA